MIDGPKIVDSLVAATADDATRTILAHYQEHVRQYGSDGDPSGVFVAGWNAALSYAIARLHNERIEQSK